PGCRPTEGDWNWFAEGTTTTTFAGGRFSQLRSTRTCAGTFATGTVSHASRCASSAASRSHRARSGSTARSFAPATGTTSSFIVYFDEDVRHTRLLERGP